jgi:hypothetical protein
LLLPLFQLFQLEQIIYIWDVQGSVTETFKYLGSTVFNYGNVYLKIW